MIKLIKFLYIAGERTVEHDGVEHAGYMSFMVLLTMFPFIVFFLALTSFLGASEVGDELLNFMADNLPRNTTEILQKRFLEMKHSPPPSLLTLAVAGTIWTASSFLEGLRTILNRIYEISTPPTYWYRRILSIVQFLAISVTISFIMFLLVVIPLMIKSIPELYNLINFTIDTIPFIKETRIITVYFSLFITVCALYYIIPNAKLTLKEIMPGALLTTILWVASGTLLSRYIDSWTQLNLIYGSIGGIILTLTFFYVISMLFIYGAEVNYMLRKKISYS